MSRFSALVVAALLVAACNAISISWTGYAANGQWNTNTNWYPDQVPGPQDDVTINSGSVVITTPVSVNSLGMGNSFSATANLTVLSSLTVFSTMTVEGNGNLLLTSGASMVSGTVDIEGGLVFSAGTLSGTVTVSKDGVANLGGAGQKAFSACGFTAAGAVVGSGVWLLNASSVVSVTSTLQAAGNFVLQAGDTSAVSVSANALTYNGGGTLLVQLPLSMTTFNFLGGNITLIDSVTFAGALTIPAGSVVRSLGMSQTALQGGVFGEGELHILGYILTAAASNVSTVIAQAGLVSFASGSFAEEFVLNGASLNLNGTFTAGSLLLSAGSVNGEGELVAETATIATPGFDVNATIVFAGSAKIASSVLALVETTGNLHVATGATLTTTGTVQINGLGGFTNNGAVSVAGSTSFTNVDITGTGSFAVSGSLTVGTNTVSAGSVALSGTGSFVGSNAQLFGITKVTGTNGVKATIGEYTLKCNTECDSVTTAGIPTSRFSFQSA